MGIPVKAKHLRNVGSIMQQHILLFIVERLSKVLGVPPKELVRKGLEELLEAQLRACFAEIAEVNYSPLPRRASTSTFC